ncbi:recombinase family protein [Cohnella sp. AR92]|uniref:recombinase family protein n=1 Tax=Cohnella sp. AR92 TaxID=648716 RepID=UPI000F8F64F0|nr:recombinase family protein [Cohnella sp. AR92]RUS44589.1 recombinase family protein [Cohnella sp. AR92]
MVVRRGYIRVSTVGQSKHGNSLESQINALLAEGVDRDNIFSDTYTGTKMDRPEFTKLCSLLKEGDTLVVTKLDRFARSMIQGAQIVNELIGRGVRVHILNIGILDNTPTSKLIRNIFFAFSEFERDMIVERTGEGKEIAKQKEGFREGRPNKFTKVQLNHAISLLETNTIKQVTNLTGISESTLKRELRKRRGA